MKKKTLVTVLALVLIFAVAVGGAVAWLVDTTNSVVNTFTVGDINITLTETGATNNAKTYKMIPGYVLSKDPTVTVKANSEDCWLFVKVEKTGAVDTYLTYSVITGTDGWTQLEGHTGVYYRTVAASTADQSFAVLQGNQVTVKDDVTKTQLNGLTEATYPKLTFTAYAIQQHKNATVDWTPADAWAALNPTTPTT